MSDADEQQNIESVILDCAEKEFAEKGYANAKLMNIAQAAHINHALIHYYFRSKRKLYESVVERLFVIWETNIKAFEWNGDNAEAIIRDYIQKYFWFHIESFNYQKIRMWDQIEGTGVFANYIEKYWQQDLDEKVEQIQVWQQRGLIKSSLNAEFIMHSIWALINHFYSFDEASLARLATTGQSREEHLDILANQLITLLLEGFLSK